MGLCFVMVCSHVVKEDETCSKVADLGLHAVTDTGRHTWHFYLCSHSRTRLVPSGCTVLKARKEGALQIYVSPPGRAHGRSYVSHGVDGILDIHIWMSRTSEARICTWHLSSGAGGESQLQVWGALTCQENFIRDTFEALCFGGTSGVKRK